MSLISRLYDFVSQTRIKSAEVDNEFNQLVAAHNQHDVSIDALIATDVELQADIDAAIATAEQAVTTANLADDTSTTALANSQSAIDTANTASANATTAVNTANSASVAATSAVNTANATKADFEALEPVMLQAVADAEAAVASVAGKADVAYVDEVANNFVMGVVPHGSLTDEYFSDTPGQIKSQVSGLYDTIGLVIDEISDLETGQTAESILTKLKTVDGSGSGLDADLFGGQETAFYAKQSDVNYLNEKTGELTMIRLNKDANDIYTEIQYKRQDGTLFKKSVLSGGTSPKYTTRTVTYYATDGTTVTLTKVFALTYTGDDLTSEVVS